MCLYKSRFESKGNRRCAEENTRYLCEGKRASSREPQPIKALEKTQFSNDMRQSI